MSVFNYIAVPVYPFDYAFYKKLKEEHRIKHGEFTKFMRGAFRQFLESHANNKSSGVVIAVPTSTNQEVVSNANTMLGSKDSISNTNTLLAFNNIIGDDLSFDSGVSSYIKNYGMNSKFI